MRGWVEAQRFRTQQEFGQHPCMGDEGIVRGEELAQVSALKGVGAATEAVFHAVFVAGRRAAFAAGGQLNVRI